MINPIHSNLYKQTSKKYVMQLLNIPNKQYLKQAYVASQIKPYIKKTPKPRLIEPPSSQLKNIQRKIKKELIKIEVPSNVFSGIKGKSYIDNAALHKGNKYVYKIDLSSFFPHITRDKVYHFFIDVLMTSPDVSELLTNLLTVSLNLSKIENNEEIINFLDTKKIKSYNHLISGSPASQILSYLVNYKMFDELQVFCDNNNITMSIYVDDITFSSNFKISHKIKYIISKIITKYGYNLSNNKTKYYTKKYPKLITGVIIDKHGNLKAKNSLTHKTINEIKIRNSNFNKDEEIKRLKGLINATQQVEPNKFINTYKKL